MQPRVRAFCVTVALLQSACCVSGTCTWQSIVGAQPSSSRPISKQELRDQRVEEALRPFLWGGRCDCADATCSATRAALDWCRGRAPECFDELLTRAPRGHVILRPTPLRFERVDDVLAANGSVRRILKNEFLVRVESRHELLVLTPLGPDTGREPLVTTLRIEIPKSDANLTIDGVEYVCAERPDNLTGLSYDPLPSPPPRTRTR